MPHHLRYLPGFLQVLCNYFILFYLFIFFLNELEDMRIAKINKLLNLIFLNENLLVYFLYQ